MCAEPLSQPGTGWFGTASAETSDLSRMWLPILQQAGYAGLIRRVSGQGAKKE